jgi:hypothetical protein
VIVGPACYNRGMTVLFLLVACSGGATQVAPEPTQPVPTPTPAPAPVPEPTPVPTPVPEPTPVPTPPPGPATYADFWALHNANACDAADTCASSLSASVYGCPDGIAPDPCTAYDPGAAAQCLAEPWTCGDLFGTPVAQDGPTCDLVCPPDDTGTP